MRSRQTGLLVLIGVVAMAVLACKKAKNDPEKEEEVQFDRSGMLTNYANNVIIPNIAMAKTSMDSLVMAYNTFTANKTIQNLQTVRQRYITATIRFQHISTFEFGPSESELVRSNFNTYPTDTLQINANIANGSYDLNTTDNIDAKGFPAVDFLLFGLNTSDTAVVSTFANAGRSNYVQNCLSEMQTRLNSILNSWNGSYRSSFISSTGSSIGSSLGLLVNQLDFEVDLLKNGKIGIPMGKKSAGTILPEKCEAYYARTISVRLAKECLTNIEDDYLGRSYAGSDGLGLDDYLTALKTSHGSGTLNDAIKAQFAIAKSKLNNVSEPLSATIVSDPATVDAAYIEIQRLLVLLKTDMPSAMGIVITYQDSDGD
jgi:hypothetical protein